MPRYHVCYMERIIYGVNAIGIGFIDAPDDKVAVERFNKEHPQGREGLRLSLKGISTDGTKFLIDRTPPIKKKSTFL